jgi:hypothetical protein
MEKEMDKRDREKRRFPPPPSRFGCRHCGYSFMFNTNFVKQYPQQNPRGYTAEDLESKKCSRFETHDQHYTY